MASSQGLIGSSVGQSLERSMTAPESIVASVREGLAKTQTVMQDLACSSQVSSMQSVAVLESVAQIAATQGLVPPTQTTIGVEMFPIKVKLEDQAVDLILVDSVGQDRFRTVSSTWYRNVSCVLLLCDVGDRRSFAAVDDWFADVERNAPKHALILFVPCKVDLVDRCVSTMECKAKAKELGVHVIETSALTGYNVEACFALIASALSAAGAGKRSRTYSNLSASTQNLLAARKSSDSVSSVLGGPILLPTVAEARPSHLRWEQASDENEDDGPEYSSITNLLSPSQQPDAATSSCFGGGAPGKFLAHWGQTLSSTLLLFPNESPSSPLAVPPAPPISINVPVLNTSRHCERPLNPIPTEFNELSLAEVIVDHAMNRARIVAGGLQPRRSSSSTLEAGLVSPTATRQKKTKKDNNIYYACILGCGALVEAERSEFHNTEECWCRPVECSLGCSTSLPMIDCITHEKESCELRTVRCPCGAGIRANAMREHNTAFRQRAVVSWDMHDVAHFIYSIVHSYTLFDVAHITRNDVSGSTLLGYKSANDFSSYISALENRIELWSALRRKVNLYDESPPANPDEFAYPYTTTTPDVSDYDKAIEYTSWPNMEKTVNRNGMHFGRGGVVSFQQRWMMKPPMTFQASSPGISPSITPGADTTTGASVVESCDGATADTYAPSPTSSAFSQQQMFAGSSSNTNRAVALLWAQLRNQQSKTFTSETSVEVLESTREVLVPLSLGNRVVAVRMIRFHEIQLNSQNLIGSGSFGSVYLGKYRGGVVAVKRLHVQNATERDLLREAAVMTSVSGHPNVLRFLGLCLERPNVCFVSESLSCSLEDWLRWDKRNKQEPLTEILRFAEEAASGLFHLHLETIVHRDIALRNLLLDSGHPPRVKVCDFGLARVLPRRQTDIGEISSGGVPVSTNTFVSGNGGGGSLELTGPLRWMAPESLRPIDGLTRFSFASDVFSFAIACWEMVSRDVPYAMLPAHEAAISVLMDNLRPPRASIPPKTADSICALLTQASPAVASDFVTLLERAWDRDPVQRPTMREVLSTLTLLRARCEHEQFVGVV